MFVGERREEPGKKGVGRCFVSGSKKVHQSQIYLTVGGGSRGRWGTSRGGRKGEFVPVGGTSLSRGGERKKKKNFKSLGNEGAQGESIFPKVGRERTRPVSPIRHGLVGGGAEGHFVFQTRGKERPELFLLASGKHKGVSGNGSKEGKRVLRRYKR